MEDYAEIFQELAEDQGSAAARSWYWRQVIRSLPMLGTNLVIGSYTMLKNYLKLAYRNILRHKRYAVLNICGLAIGLAACLLMAGYVLHELSFENMHPLKEQIFRINGRIPYAGQVLLNGVVGAPLGPAVADSIPEVEKSVRLYRRHNVPVRIDDRDFKEQKMFFAENEILQVFSLPLLRGDQKTALAAPFSVIIDENLAEKYFGDQDPLGRTIQMTLQKVHEFTVTGIMRKIPSNTILQRPMIASFQSLLQTNREAMLEWQSWGNITTFVLLKAGMDPESVSAKITALARANLPDDEKEASYYLQPLGKIYINNEGSGINNDLDNSGSITRLYVFSAVALLILLIAAINFINLTTAKITGRMKEVGIRKTCGAYRSHLIKQFLMESLLLTTIAMGLGLLLFSLFKPRLDVFLGKTLSLSVLNTPWILPSVGVLVLLVGFLAGSYPAVFLSRFPAAVIFRSGSPQGVTRSGLRRFLVGFQFFVAAVLIICTLVVLKQVHFSETKDPGFDRDGLVVLRNRDAHNSKNSIILKNQIISRAGVAAVSTVGSFPTAQNRNISNIRLEGQTEEKGKIFQSMEIDEDFITTMGLELISGRNFEAGRGADQQNILLNETAVKSLELDEPVGAIVFRGEKNFRIIGVVRDWNTNSLHSRIYPTVLFHANEAAGALVIRLPDSRAQETIARIREIWSGMLPNQIFDYAYVDDLNMQAYAAERRLASLLISFCQLTVLVACLGIFGLAAYSTEQRTKEIGIRKVLGSSVAGIVLMLTRSYVRWVLVANLLAWPAAYLLVNRWLQDFSFRTAIGLDPFLLAGLITLMVALFSVIFQTLRAATASPVYSLRYE